MRVVKVSNLTIEDIRSNLQKAGYKLTPQREATVSILLDRDDEHLSAEEIYILVKQKAPEIGLATVYRTLEILTDLHLTHKVVFEDGLSRYDLQKNRGHHFHHHLECVECGKIEEIEEDLLDEVEQEIEQRFGFLVQDHQLTFQGICKKCQQNRKE
ncbi:ferric iron uptake transcriptional regulator [Granulicatella balaenopterae]|uniref:ferric iron uptake transcriptional regulator n=1 Tax=Granulicatella balaenopterae TaxID=137733 RepID=UPI000B7CD3DA